ncbi:unnamed protein product [Brassicogethes aeneus]|uniref:Uncharacterized protein n=1 Tax=Brassicogethes aeneus TaxID=1431903 RepID=A0A9P0ATZ4_BRAAE|nr:unnamed protein product [Brassicogethes aeneus]
MHFNLVLPLKTALEQNPIILKMAKVSMSGTHPHSCPIWHEVSTFSINIFPPPAKRVENKVIRSFDQSIDLLQATYICLCNTPGNDQKIHYAYESSQCDYGPILAAMAKVRGAGGLLLDTGSGPSFLPLPAPVLEQVAAGNSEPGVTTLKLPDSFQKSTDPGVREVDVEVCFVCKKCRLAFPGESPLLTHQRQCFGPSQESRGAFRIVQTGFECKACNRGERFKSLMELRKHCEGAEHQSRPVSSVMPAPSESPLSHEMEDVVNQITLLAARAAQETTPVVVDSNSNSFCQPTEPKRRYLAPNDVSQPLTTGH